MPVFGTNIALIISKQGASSSRCLGRVGPSQRAAASPIFTAFIITVVDVEVETVRTKLCLQVVERQLELPLAQW